MTIEYKLEEDDLLTLMLFVASKSDSVKKSRQKNQLFITAGQLFLVIYLMYYYGVYIGGAYIFVGIFWYFMYPKIESRQYLKSYKTQIRETYKNLLNKNYAIIIGDEKIRILRSEEEKNLLINDIKEINEIPDYVFIGMRTGESLILPLRKVDHAHEIIIRVKDKAHDLNVPYITDSKWVWK